MGSTGASVTTASAVATGAVGATVVGAACVQAESTKTATKTMLSTNKRFFIYLLLFS
jgi:hypothetical protein